MTNDPSHPDYNAKARDAIIDLCPFYDPNHKCDIVRAHIFKDCVNELRERNRLLINKVIALEKLVDELEDKIVNGDDEECDSEDTFWTQYTTSGRDLV
jgi:hypothetical protein